METKPIKKLRVWRMERGLTQEELADLSQADRSSISRVEQGRRTSLNIKSMHSVSKALGVTYDQIEEFLLAVDPDAKKFGSPVLVNGRAA